MAVGREPPEHMEPPPAPVAGSGAAATDSDRATVPIESSGAAATAASFGARGRWQRRLAEVGICGFLPGALLGVHVAGLLFFLNPALPWRFLPVTRAFAWYGGELGLASLCLHLPLLAKGRRSAARVLPWTATAALALSAVLDWTHASRYAYYLPAGINWRLIKTAIWLSVAALIAFYTAFLHTLARRAYGWRSRILLGLLCCLSILVLVERRSAFHPRLSPPPRPAVVEKVARPRLWVVGLDTATLDAILPLAGQGQLPFLATVLKQGAYGRLESFSPVRREALWTTLATGKYPWQHGVTGNRLFSARNIAEGAELRLLPAGIFFDRWGLLPAQSRVLHGYTRQALTFWEILPRVGIPAGVVGWPASSPALPGDAFALTDRYFVAPPEAGDCMPADLCEPVRRLRPDAAAVRAMLSARFTGGSPAILVDTLRTDLWREEAVTALLLRHPEVRGVFLGLPGLRQVSRRWFGGFSEVQFKEQQAADFQDAAARVTDYYMRLDAFLGELWQRRGDDDILAVVSAFGIDSASGWRRVLGQVSREASLEGSESGAPDGVLMLYGRGIRAGALLTGAHLVDVVPTLMYALHLPVASDLDGQVLTPAFDKSFLAQHPLTFLPTYEAVPAPPPG